MSSRQLVLASQSPRRKQLLKQIGLKFEVRESEYEEDMTAKNDPYELVKYLALKKTQDVARHYLDAIIIGADTFVVSGGKFLGKPGSEEKAREMLESISGKEVGIVTGFAVIDTKSGKTINDFGEARATIKKT